MINLQNLLWQDTVMLTRLDSFKRELDEFIAKEKSVSGSNNVVGLLPDLWYTSEDQVLEEASAKVNLPSDPAFEPPLGCT